MWALAAADRNGRGEPDPGTPRCLGAQGINVLVRRVQNAIIARGYVTALVLVEPQDLNTGTLALSVVPGRLRAVRFADGTSPRATQWNAVPTRAGDLLNLRDVEQALENFKRVQSVDADIQIVPASGPDAKAGESDLVIVWKETNPFHLSVSLDDAGSETTGKYQMSATVSYDHWWTLNDRFYVSANRDVGGRAPGPRGTNSYTAHYSVPYGYWLLGATGSNSDYFQSVAGAAQTYIYSGESRNLELQLSRLVYRNATRKLSVIAKAWSRQSSNYIDDTEVLVQRRQMGGWDLGFSHQEYIGNSTVQMQLNYRRGTGAFDSMPAPEESFGEGTSRPKIVTADASLNVPFVLIGQRLRFNTQWRAQWNDTPLIPQDRFSIGGRYTVRGFDGEFQLVGERGWLVRNDIGWSLPTIGELYLAADYGQVGGPSAEYLVGKRLAGAAMGVRGTILGVMYDVFIGKPISKPQGLVTSSPAAGFSLHWSH